MMMKMMMMMIKCFVLFHTASSNQAGRNIHADSTAMFKTAHICNQTLDDTHIERERERAMTQGGSRWNLTAVSIPRLSMWGLWRMKWNLDTFFSQYLGFA